VLHEVIAKGALQREQRIPIPSKHVIRNDCALVNTSIFYEPHAFQFAGLNHKRRVGRIDHLAALGQPLLDESQKVGLRSRMQSDRWFVQQNHDRRVTMFVL
jgi:hypothetical protein